MIRIRMGPCAVNGSAHSGRGRRRQAKDLRNPTQ